MVYIVTLEATAKPDCIENMKAVLKNTIPVTREFSGCIMIDIHEDVETQGRFMFFEKWESQEHYKNYFAWRSQSAAMKELGPMLAGPPRIHCYECLDI